MDIIIRPAVPADISACGQIAYAAFKDINERHGFENLEYSTVEIACHSVESKIHHPFSVNIVAEAGGQVIGLCLLDEHNSIRGVELVCVDPSVQGKGVGRKLMVAALERCLGASGVRLIQHAFNPASLALYASLGFAVKEPLMLVYGRPVSQPPHGFEVRPMRNQDLDECGRLYEQISGFRRDNEIQEYLELFSPYVALRENLIVAYAAATAMLPYNHIAAENETCLQALLLGTAASMPDPLIIPLPVRQAGLFRWCLEQGLRAVKPYTLMALGFYQEPAGICLPSVLF
jgi:GNAT superfamily N-acetyltransferase